MAVVCEPVSLGAAGCHTPAVAWRVFCRVFSEPGGRRYDVAPDGRFLVNTVLNSAAAPITLLQNWRPPAARQHRLLFDEVPNPT